MDLEVLRSRLGLCVVAGRLVEVGLAPQEVVALAGSLLQADVGRWEVETPSGIQQVDAVPVSGGSETLIAHTGEG